MERVFIDTSGWVALFVANDENHGKAVSIFEDLKRQRALLFTSDYVVDETITTVLARGDHRQSVLAGTAFFSSKIVEIVQIAPEYLEKSWELYQKYKDKRFSFTDVTSFAVMREFKISKAFSFDRGFSQAGFELLG